MPEWMCGLRRIGAAAQGRRLSANDPVCGNREDAEDVLIKALLKAYRHLDQLRESPAFRAWLAQIANAFVAIEGAQFVAPSVATVGLGGRGP